MNKKRALGEVRVQCTSPTLVKNLRNIAKNSGVTLSALLKPHLQKICDSYPEHMKSQRNLD
jgi:hypothetical protein